MRMTWQHARAFAVALVAGALYGTGCGTTGQSRTRVPATGPMPQQSPPLTLDSNQLRRSEAAAHFAVGVSAEIRWDFDAALPQYLRSLELDPRNGQLAARVGQIYLNRHNSTNAIAMLEASTRTNPSVPDTWFLLGYAYRTTDQVPKAVAAFRQALKLDPTHLPTIRVLLDTYLQQDSSSDVTPLVDQLTNQISRDPAYWTGLGDVFVAAIRAKPSVTSQIDRTRIRQCYERALALAPRDLDILARAADAYTDSGEYKLAADAFAKLLEGRPDNQQLLDRLWRMYVRSDQKDKAMATLEELIKRDPLRFEVYNALGDLYEDVDRTDRAIANYQQSLVLNPNQLELYVRIALAQMRLKKYPDAVLTLTTAKEKFPTKYQVPYLVGLLESEQKNYTNALAAFADADTLAKEDTEEVKPSSAFYFSYGSTCERNGDPEKAATLFRKAIDLDPNNHNACNYLGYMWADKGVHLEESLELIQKALKFDPDNGAYLDSLGWVLFKLGQYEEALPHLRRAIELIKKDDTQEDATVLDHLAEVLLKLGKHDEAVDTLRRAVKADPDNKDLAEKLHTFSANHTASPK